MRITLTSRLSLLAIGSAALVLVALVATAVLLQSSNASATRLMRTLEKSDGWAFQLLGDSAKLQ
ncbi:MAG: hypothetical protein WCL50_19740, partial [Spirochaetota bacterium]